MIGIYDDFVRLGGDSLTAIRLLTQFNDYNISAGDILSLRTPYAIAKAINNKFDSDLDIYDFESGCPLNESQLNVYLDIVTHNKKDAYLIPLFMEISKDYDIDSIIDALNIMLNIHPILSMCISDEFDVPYLVPGFKPSIIVESDVNDEFITKFLTKPFVLHDNLSRFLIIEKNDCFILYSVFHHIIFDALSDAVFKQDLYNILDGRISDLDDSFLKVSAFNQQIAESSDYVKAEKFYP